MAAPPPDPPIWLLDPEDPAGTIPYTVYLPPGFEVAIRPMTLDTLQLPVGFADPYNSQDHQFEEVLRSPRQNRALSPPPSPRSKPLTPASATLPSAPVDGDSLLQPVGAGGGPLTTARPPAGTGVRPNPKQPKEDDWDVPHTLIFLPDIEGFRDRECVDVARKLAELHNYIVVVPDLFRGCPWTPQHDMVGTDVELWRRLHPDSRVDHDVQRVISFAHSRFRNPKGRATKIALFGMCYGGAPAYRALRECNVKSAGSAGVLAHVSAGVLAYPCRIATEDTATRMKNPPVMFLMAEQDDVCTETLPMNYKQYFARLKKQAEEFMDFMNTRHGFIHRPRTAFERQCSELALQGMARWLDLKLGDLRKRERDGWDPWDGSGKPGP